MFTFFILSIIVAIAIWAGYKARQRAKFYHRIELKLEIVDQALQVITDAKELTSLLILHKQLGKSLSLNNSPYIGPSPTGLFRTQDIRYMGEEEVFLNGKTLNIWEKQRDSEEYQYALSLYKESLSSGLRHIKSQLENVYS